MIFPVIAQEEDGARGSFVITNPDLIRWELDWAENDVATKQAIVETARAGLEFNAPMWLRWDDQTKACLARSKVLESGLREAVTGPAAVLGCGAIFAQRRLELNRALESVTERYDECCASLGRALARIKDTGRCPTLDRAPFEEFEAVRERHVMLLEMFRRGLERLCRAA